MMMMMIIIIIIIIISKHRQIKYQYYSSNVDMVVTVLMDRAAVDILV
uniref:Uncharacterized protein n=1 Tax=Anguilla anguilla TaxID=7936 RepID=A0A0E9W6V2_ANGAN